MVRLLCGCCAFVSLFLLAPLSLSAQPAASGPSFGTNGVTLFPAGRVHTVVLQSNGKALVGGALEDLNGSLTGALWRFQADGTPDLSFGTDGLVEIEAPEGGWVWDVAALPSGSILASGAEFGFGPFSALWRFHADGVLDTSFGENGVVRGSTGTFTSLSVGTSELESGRIIASRTTLSDVLNDPYYCIAHRYLHDGSADPSLGGDGAVAVAPDELTACSTHTLLDESRLVLFLSREPEPLANVYHWGAARLLQDGTPDPDFGIDGVAMTTGLFGGSVMAGDVGPDGSVTVGGCSHGNCYSQGTATLVRFTEDGALDTAFGVDGIARLTELGDAEIRDLVIQQEGEIIVTGRREVPGGVYAAFVARVMPDGTLDPRFGEGGFVTPDLGVTSGSQSEGNTIVLTPDAHLIVAGEYSGGGFVARLLPDGTVNAEGPAPLPQLSFGSPSPNPAAGQTTLSFDLTHGGPVRLAIYDLLGREVAILLDAVRGPGRHEVLLDASRYAPGVYLLRLLAAEKQRTRSLTVVR